MIRVIVFLSLLFLSGAFTALNVSAHCDTMGGPVIETAKKALEGGDITPVLKWVKPDYEQAIRDAFERTMAVRGESPEAQELADMYFFETLVRLHREGEGAPYTGLKPVGEIEPIIQLSDKALETGNVDFLIREVSEKVAAGIRERFEHAAKAKKEADSSVEAGREFVEAYVLFTHYVEKLHLDAEGHGAAHGEE